MSVNNSYLVGLFSNSSSSSSANMFSVLASAYSASAATASTASAASHPIAPTPPWDTPDALANSASSTSSSSTGISSLTPAQSALVQQALQGRPVIDPNAAKLNVSSKNASVNQDYKNLFALYQGLNTLSALTQQMKAPGTGTLEASEIKQAFNNGLSQVSSFLQGNNFHNVTIVQGGVSTSATSKVAVSQGSPTYVGQNIVQGSSADAAPAFEGAVQFSMTVTKDGVPQTLNFDLGQMGSETRSLTNVVNYLNGQLSAAGVKTRFATQRTAGEAQTVQVGSSSVSLSTPPDQYALVLNGVPSETVSFSAPATADAVYVAQGSGAGGAAGQQLLKFQTDTTEGGTPPAALAQPQDTHVTSGEAWQDNLPSTVTGVQATAAGPDGSVYVLANVNGTTSGQPIQGAGDVALLKYDSAGNLQFTQTLGASVSASGLGLAVSADGEVAVTGQATGSLNPGDGLSSTAQSAFVSVYGASGDQLWSQTIPADSGSQANAVAFGADDSVYVVGKTNSQILGATGSTSVSGTTSFLAGFSASGVQQSVTQFGASTGGDNATGVTVDGSQVLVAGVENGSAVVRSYQIGANGGATLTATQNLGALNGGSVAGLALNNGQLVVAGTTHNTALAAGTTTAAGGAGSNAFVASLDPSLQPSSSDSIAYYQSQGGTTVTAVSVANGNVYIAGQTGPTLTDPAASSSSSSTSGSATSTSSSSSKPTTGQAGYIAQIDPTSGQVGFTTSLQGEGGIAAPTSITVSTAGASVLDRLGLPQGTIDQNATSDLLTTASSLQPGDYFYIQPGPGLTPLKVTIQAEDTLKTLATRIAQASDFRLAATVNTSVTSQTLSLSALVPGQQVQILAGPPGQNALPSLGLAPGLIQSSQSQSSSSSSSTPAQTTFGLNLSSTLDLNSSADISHAASQLAYAMSEVMSAYQALVSANTPKSAQSAAPSGPLPAYLQAQIANYQAGLARLTGS